MPTMMRAISPRNTPRTRFMRNLPYLDPEGRCVRRDAAAAAFVVRASGAVGRFGGSSLAIKGTRERDASQNAPSIFNPR